MQAPRIELFDFRYRDPRSGDVADFRRPENLPLGVTLRDLPRARPRSGPGPFDLQERYFAPRRQITSDLGHVFAIAGSSRSVPIAGVAS